MKKVIAALSFAFVAPAFAQEMPVPKMFKGMAGQKGQYQVEMLEGGGRSAPKGSAMTVCTDNLMRQDGAAKGKDKDKRPASDCKQRLLKDAADEAIVETVCKDRTTTVTMKRESAKSVLMTMASTGARGPQEMKMRYTHLGPCRAGQGAISMDKNSEQCRQMKAQQAQMDPAKACAGAGANRAQCEKQMRDALAQASSMCN